MVTDGKFIGHNALVTGISNPIGFTIAKLLVSEGCLLHIADYDEQVLKNCFDNFKGLYNVDTEIHQMDLSEPINISVLALECQDANIVINTMGTTKKGGINQLDHEDWKNDFELNLLTAINLTGEVLDSVYEQENGIIINVGGTVDGIDVENICTISINAALQAFSETLDKKTKIDGLRILYFLPQANISTEKNADTLNHLISEKLFP